jgi:hypothetical protein
MIKAPFNVSSAMAGGRGRGRGRLTNPEKF